MALPFIFATQPTGNVPASDLDTNFNAVGAMAITQCTAVGTNTITLTPSANQPAVASYANYQQFSFVPAANSTSSVSLQVGSLASLPVYLSDGVTQAGSGTLSTAQLIVIAYDLALNSGSGGFQILNNTLAFARGQITGSNTNDSSNAGNIGEYISSTIGSGSAVSLTTVTAANVTSISLTAGDWDVWGNVGFSPSASPVAFWGAINTTSATLPGAPNGGAYFLISGQTWSAGSLNVFPIGMMRISLSTTTTVYLIAQSQFSSGTVGAYGFIGARRAR